MSLCTRGHNKDILVKQKKAHYKATYSSVVIHLGMVTHGIVVTQIVMGEKQGSKIRDKMVPRGKRQQNTLRVPSSNQKEIHRTESGPVLYPPVLRAKD